MSNHKKTIIAEIWNELWSGCGEQLEQIDPSLWNKYMTKALMNMLVNEREMTKYYKKRIEINENNRCRAGI